MGTQHMTGMPPRGEVAPQPGIAELTFFLPAMATICRDRLGAGSRGQAVAATGVPLKQVALAAASWQGVRAWTLCMVPSVADAAR